MKHEHTEHVTVTAGRRLDENKMRVGWWQGKGGVPCETDLYFLSTMPTSRMCGGLSAVALSFETGVSFQECKGNFNEPQQFCD